MSRNITGGSEKFMISLQLRDGAPYGVAMARMSPLLTLLLLKPDIQKNSGLHAERCCEYPGAESNCYQKFRKLLFYPLNYRGILCIAVIHTTKLRKFFVFP